MAPYKSGKISPQQAMLTRRICRSEHRVGAALTPLPLEPAPIEDIIGYKPSLPGSRKEAALTTMGGKTIFTRLERSGRSVRATEPLVLRYAHQRRFFPLTLTPDMRGLTARREYLPHLDPSSLPHAVPEAGEPKRAAPNEATAEAEALGGGLIVDFVLRCLGGLRRDERAGNGIRAWTKWISWRCTIRNLDRATS